jgi:hypothetical protein
MDDVLLPPRKQIIETDDLMTVADQSITEVAAQKSGATGYEDAHDLESRKLQVESRRKSGRRRLLFTTPHPSSPENTAGYGDPALQNAPSITAHRRAATPAS